jgi:hypothetical protein
MYDPSDDDDEIPGQDALWEPLPAPEPVAGVDSAPLPSYRPNPAGAPNSAGASPSPGTAKPAAAPKPAGIARPAGIAKPAGASRPAGAANRAPSTAGKGITGRGVVVLVAVVTGIVGIVEVIASGHRGPLFGAAFVLASAAGAYLVRRRDLLAAVVAPPLIYCGLIVFMSLIDSGDTTGGLVTRLGVYIADAFVTGAPSIWIATAAAAAIAWWRSGGTWRSRPPALTR